MSNNYHKTLFIEQKNESQKLTFAFWLTCWTQITDLLIDVLCVGVIEIIKKLTTTKIEAII